jgi:Trk-type K+ transport system membrane component
MIDITKDEFWDVRSEEIVKEKAKKNKIIETILKHKLLSLSLILFLICVIANIVLIYNFLKIIKMY